MDPPGGIYPRTWILDPSQGLYLEPERNDLVMLQVLKKGKIISEKINVGGIVFGWYLTLVATS